MTRSSRPRQHRAPFTTRVSCSLARIWLAGSIIGCAEGPEQGWHTSTMLDPLATTTPVQPAAAASANSGSEPQTTQNAATTGRRASAGMADQTGQAGNFSTPASTSNTEDMTAPEQAGSDAELAQQEPADEGVSSAGQEPAAITDQAAPSEAMASPSTSVADDCPDDASKAAPGACGCGVPDLQDQDGTVYCPTACVSPCFPYATSTIDSAQLNPTASPATTLIDCELVFDSGGDTPGFNGDCGSPLPRAQVVSQPGGPDVAVLALNDLQVTAEGRVRLLGSRPVVWAVYGDADLMGTLDAGARGQDPGPGADGQCGDGAGQAGQSDTGSSDGGGGGGGGSFGTAGARGGEADAEAGNGGQIAGAADLQPLRGGCAGGQGGAGTRESRGREGGAGGGAFQLSVAGQLTLHASTVLSAQGGGGQPGTAQGDGGGGGGSGGALLVEALQVVASDLPDPAAVLRVYGGGGAAGSNERIFDANSGEDGHTADDQAAAGGTARDGRTGGRGATQETEATSGERGGDDGGGGGGGGLGRSLLRDVSGL